MEKALLQNLMAGAGSSSQFVGGLTVAIFWTSFLVVIAAFYLSFAAYFGPQFMLGKLN
jgi:hypothetical protein